jgi:hypothetical protein
MICPQCKAEYRRGFTVCADCGAPLLGSIELARVRTAEDEPAATPGDPNKDPFCSFWKGTDLRVCTEICAVLDEAGIPHKTIRRQDHLFNLNNQAPYEVGVPASLYEEAELAIHDAFGTDAESAEDAVYKSQTPRLLPDTTDHVTKAGIFAPLLDMAKSQGRGLMRDLKEFEQVQEPEWEVGEEPSRGAGHVPRGGLGLDGVHPEDATALVWKGNPPHMREMIAMSLQENDIFARYEARGATTEVYVLPEDEERAREIVREIMEGQAPG